MNNYNRTILSLNKNIKNLINVITVFKHSKNNITINK